MSSFQTIKLSLKFYIKFQLIQNCYLNIKITNFQEFIKTIKTKSCISKNKNYILSNNKLQTMGFMFNSLKCLEKLKKKLMAI